MTSPLREKLMIGGLFVLFVGLYFTTIAPNKSIPPRPTTVLDGFVSTLTRVVNERDLPAYLLLWHVAPNKKHKLDKRRDEFIHNYGVVLRRTEGISRALPNADLKFTGPDSNEISFDYDFREFKKTKHGTISLIRIDNHWKLTDFD